MTAEEKWNAAIEECGAELGAKYHEQEYYIATKGDNVKVFYYDVNATGPLDEDSPYGMILLPSLDEIRKNEALHEFINDNDGYTHGVLDDYNAWFDGKTDECPLDGEDLYNFVDECPDGFDTADYTIYENDLVKKTVHFEVVIEVECPEQTSDDGIEELAIEKACDMSAYDMLQGNILEITND